MDIAVSSIGGSAVADDGAAILIAVPTVSDAVSVPPVLVDAPAAAVAVPSNAVSGLGEQTLAWLAFGAQFGGDGRDAPGSSPLMWAALGLVRRDLAAKPGATITTSPTSTSDPVNPGAPGVMSKPAKPASASAVDVGGIRLFGDGTAEHPDGGILFGNGFSWTT